MEYEEINKFVIGNELKLATSFCRTTKTYGGTGIFTKFDLNRFRVMTEINNMSFEMDCEIACIELLELKILLVTIYRSPRGDIDRFFEVMEKMLSYINRLYKQVIILGDFNINFITHSKNQECLINLLSMYGVDQTIFEPTRNRNCLDNVFTSLKENYTSSVINNHISDHLGQLFSLDVNTEVEIEIVLNNCKVKEVLNDNSMREFKYYLNKESWGEIINLNDVNEGFNTFLDTIEHYYNIAFIKNCSKKYKKNNNVQRCKKVNWYNSELRGMRERLDFLYELYKSSGNCYYHNVYKREKMLYRLKLKETKKKANASYINNSGNKNKALWSIVNLNNNNRHSAKVGFSPDVFNDYFVSVARNVDKLNDITLNSENKSQTSKPDFMDYLKNNNVPDRMDFCKIRLVTVDEVIKTVMELASKRSKDHFGLTNNLVKDSIKCIANPLTILINKCFEQGVFPDVLKTTKVHPIFKKGSKDQLSNYRPVAIVPVFSKIIEALIGKQLMQFLENNDLLCKEQFGFRKGLATTHAIISLVEKILNCYEKKYFAAVTFCDLSKAFDRVSHSILLKKLQYYNVKESAFKFFESYLKGRKQYVFTELGSSSNREVTDGVPQGSVLGPLLFLVAINDLRSNVPTDIVLYADDTTIITRNTNYKHVQEEAKCNINLVDDWLMANNLILNQDKTKTVMFSLREFPGSLEVQNSTFLGLTFDSKLNWHQHTINLKKKLSSGIFALKRLTGEIEGDSVIQAYYGLFHCHLSYGLIVWGSSSHAEEVFLMQKKALRVISGAADLDHCKPLFIESKILTLYSLYIYQSIVHLRNNIDQLSFRADIHNYNTRSKNNVDLPHVRLEKTVKSPLIMGSKLYNKLPADLRLLKDNQFKSKLKRYLCQKAFYSIKEFELCTMQDFL